MKVYIVWAAFYNGCDEFVSLDSVHRTQDGADARIIKLYDDPYDPERQSFNSSEEEVIE